MDLKCLPFLTTYESPLKCSVLMYKLSYIQVKPFLSYSSGTNVDDKRFLSEFCFTIHTISI